MFDDTLGTFLEKPLLARLSTIDDDGYPHTVPVWFIRDKNEIVVITFRKTRKVRLIQKNPKGAMIIGDDLEDGGGYLIKGDFALEEDPDRYWMKTVTYRYESGEKAEKDIAEWGKVDMIIIRLKPKSITKV